MSALWPVDVVEIKCSSASETMSNSGSCFIKTNSSCPDIVKPKYKQISDNFGEFLLFSIPFAFHLNSNHSIWSVMHRGEVGRWVEHFVFIARKIETFSVKFTRICLRIQVETGTQEPVNGVIRAIFKIGSIVMVGVEIDDSINCTPLTLTNGSFSGHQFFDCPSGKALFIEAECCHKDNRFSDDFVMENTKFGHPESPLITESVAPISKVYARTLAFCGLNQKRLNNFLV